MQNFFQDIHSRASSTVMAKPFRNRFTDSRSFLSPVTK
ncbi:hypothetical protein GACE_2266 [Geoglobus acetivorans]|uniref:Uncharacterized protein n=1 Tax=Geoglobus acetivorans TaxID=565033 RepID=A0A0A7GEJ3_GEOAI|nr:hypothetical protein GACE_2266 [Geoglobus acetivorans]